MAEIRTNPNDLILTHPLSIWFYDLTQENFR
jgi:hypothetical protein